MTENNQQGKERRGFARVDFAVPLAYKICKPETVSQLLKGYTSNVSQSGILCRITEPVQVDEILWLSFDRATLDICEQIESRVLIYQNGVVGKVARVSQSPAGEFEVGIRFITREEENSSHIYPKVYFIRQKLEKA